MEVYIILLIVHHLLTIQPPLSLYQHYPPLHYPSITHYPRYRTILFYHTIHYQHLSYQHNISQILHHTFYPYLFTLPLLLYCHAADATTESHHKHKNLATTFSLSGQALAQRADDAMEMVQQQINLITHPLKNTIFR